MSDTPNQSSPGSRIGVSRRVLSCTSCRQRKIKCNKADRCDSCSEAGIECVYPTRRVRQSKVQRNALKTRDQELLGRIQHLESLLVNGISTDATRDNTQSSNDVRDSAADSPLSTASGHVSRIEPGLAVDNHYLAFIKRQRSSSRHLNNNFWLHLNDEFDGLKQFIESPVDDNDESDEDESISTSSTYVSSDLIWQTADSLKDGDIIHPSNAHSVVLFQFYFRNVDSICKVLHRPTVNAYYSNLKALFDPQTRRFKFRSLEAATFAIYFAAVTSISPDDCLDYFGQKKTILVAQYKHYSEMLLVQADFMNSLELTTLQAFTIYIIARRTLSQGRSDWSLVGLAMRIAHGLGLHQDGDGRTYDAFEAEMRRRLFWQIMSLDMRASEDRGFEPRLAQHCFDTTLPCNINDDDFGLESQHPLQSKIGRTDMTICLLEIDALCTIWKLNLRPSISHSVPLTHAEREDLVKAYAQRVEDTYLANCDNLQQWTRFLRTVGQYWIHKLWLLLYYPLHGQAPIRHVRSSIQGLETALQYLKCTDIIEHHPSSAGFSWYFKAHTPWHAVAVALTEVCNNPHNALADQAWDFVQSGFKEWTVRVSGTKETLLWGPINKILKRAEAARNHNRDDMMSQEGLPTPLENHDGADGTPTVPSDSQKVGVSMGYPSQPLSDVSVAANQSMDYFAFARNDVSGPMSSSASDCPDFWNNFTFDMNALGEDHVSDMALFGTGNPGYFS